jgi:tetratricopeptide (TPR) repeat protein
MNPKIPAALIATLLAALGLLAPESTPDPAHAARLNNLGCAYMNQQLFEKALNEFKEAATQDPKLAIARLNQAIAYLNLQKVDEAKPILESVLKQDQKNPYAWYNLGLLAKNTGDAQAAIEAFKHVTEIDPNDADAWYFLGSVYVQAKQFPQAIDAFQHTLQLNPLHASAEFGLSRAYQQSADVDHAREHLKKFQYITQKKIGAPISLAYGEQGQYSRAVESPQAQLKPPPQIKVRFVDVTKEAGITGKIAAGRPGRYPTAIMLSPGACFLDYDNDGKIDLFLPDNGAESGMSLYHNRGNGVFEDVTRKAGIDASAHAIGCTAGDYDNDGYTDLAVSYDRRVLLLHNDKHGKFSDVTEAAGIKPTGLNIGVTFLDYDHDGDIDLYIVKFSPPSGEGDSGGDEVWRNNGNGTFTEVSKEIGLSTRGLHTATIGTDYNNDRAVDIVLVGRTSAIFENRREGKFVEREPWTTQMPEIASGSMALDFDHDGWMDLAFTHPPTSGAPAITLWRNNHGKTFDRVPLPETNWVRAYGIAAFDYDNDGWVDLVAVGETKEGKGEVRLFRNLGPDGFKDVTADVGLDRIHLAAPRAIITGDYDNDGATDLLITQNHGPAVLLRNEGGNQNHWLRLALKGLNDNKSAIGTKVEVFAGGNRQKFEIYGSNGYLGQNSPYLTVGLGEAKEADIVRMLWPTGVLQDEINIAGDKQQDFLELDRRGSSCPTLFVWNGERYEFVADMLGAGVVGHWVGPNQRDIPRPVEYIKIDRNMIREISNETLGAPLLADFARSGTRTTLSFRFMEPLEEAVYLDQVRLLAVDHPADLDVYPNEYFASNPPYPEFKVVVSRDAKLPAGAWDDHGHNVLPDLLAHRYFGDFALTQFQGFAKPHSLTLDLGEPYNGGPLWLLLHGEVEYFSANSMYAASQANVQAISPCVEALVSRDSDVRDSDVHDADAHDADVHKNHANGKWQRVLDDMGFPAGGPRTMTADLTGKLPRGTQKIRITTNLQIYWDNILIDRTEQTVTPASDRLSRARPAVTVASEVPVELRHPFDKLRAGSERSRSSGEAKDLASSATAQTRVTPVPLVRADLEFHGFPLKIEGTPSGNVNYIYEKASATGPYTRPAGTYTRYGDVLPLLTANDDRLAVFGSGDEVQLDFDPSHLPALPEGWVRDYFFAANGYEKDMDFYAAEGNYVAPLPFLRMGEYPYAVDKSFPLDDAHLNYLLEYNTRHMSGNEQRGYWFDYTPGRLQVQSPPAHQN